MKLCSVRPILFILLGLILSACSWGPSRPPTDTAAQSAPTSSLVQMGAPGVAPQGQATATPTAAPAQPGLTIHVDGPARAFDRRLLGTNVPAWLGDNLKRPEILELTVALDSTVLRLPGGSWSNAYNWLACETGDTSACWWPTAARPSDFLAFVRATGQEAMWTVSFNGTAQEAAALVAFFNGSVDDERPIGIDVRGRDWKTVGEWARLRATNGSPEPLPIRLWEIGNEVYGGKEGMGADCSAWGWEDVWTCDGREYVAGKNVDGVRHEGYLEFRTAMRAIDPTILVGAVGVADPGEWSNWGNEVISTAGDNLDFYVVHHYPYSSPPTSAPEVLAQPQQTWPRIMGDLQGAFERQGGARSVPVAVTEHNLVAFLDLDSGQLMRRAVNALFIADSIGQMAESGVAMANQWNLANGRLENGSDYGLIDIATGERNPQYYGLLVWSRFGSSLLPVESSFAPDTVLSAYAGRDDNGEITLIAINKTDQELAVPLRLEPAKGPYTVTADELRADTLESTSVLWNGVADPAADLSDAPGRELGTFTGEGSYTFAPYSVTLLRFTPQT
jgi:hypothetical protein